MLRKKVKLNEAWTKELSTQENLEGSVHNLKEALDSIKSTVQLFNTVNNESLRQSQVTTFNIPYELVTERDISIAKQDLSKELLPQCFDLLSRAQGLLNKLKQDETELYKTLQAQAIHVDGLKRNPATQPTFQSNRINTQRREELKNKKKQLEYLIQVEQEKINEETLEITKIKANNEELKKRKEFIQSNEGWEQKRIELLQELSELKDEANKKMTQTKELSNVDKKINTSILSLRESKVLHKQHLDGIQNVLNQLNQMSKGSTVQCEIQCNKYIQGLDKENNNMIKLNQELNIMIEQVKSLCYTIYNNHLSGKTAGKVFEFILLNDKVTTEELSKIFPWTEDERHGLTSILLELLQVNIIKQDGNNNFY